MAIFIFGAGKYLLRRELRDEALICLAYSLKVLTIMAGKAEHQVGICAPC